MSIEKVFFTIKCDEPGCETYITIESADGDLFCDINTALRARGWRSIEDRSNGELSEYCPTHRRDR